MPPSSHNDHHRREYRDHAWNLDDNRNRNDGRQYDDSRNGDNIRSRHRERSYHTSNLDVQESRAAASETIKVKVEKDLMPPPPPPPKRPREIVTPEPRIKRERTSFSPFAESRAGSRARTFGWRPSSSARSHAGSREQSVATSTSPIPGPSRARRSASQFSTRSRVSSGSNRSDSVESFASTAYMDPLDPHSRARLKRPSSGRSRNSSTTPAGRPVVVPAPLPDGLGRSLEAAKGAIKALSANDKTEVILDALFGDITKDSVVKHLGGEVDPEADIVVVPSTAHVTGAMTVIRGALALVLGAEGELSRWWVNNRPHLTSVVIVTGLGATKDDARAVLESAGMEWRSDAGIRRVATAAGVDVRRALQRQRGGVHSAVNAIERLAELLVEEVWE